MPLVNAGQRVTAGLLSQDYSAGGTSQVTVTAATLTPLSTVFTIPAGDMQIGTAYRLTAYGNGTQGSTAQTLQVAWMIGGVMGSSFTWPTTFEGTSNAFRWRAVLELVCLGTGTSGTVQGCVEMTYAHGAPLSLNGAGCDQASATVNTTTALSWALGVAWGATTGAPTITCTASIFEKLGG